MTKFDVVSYALSKKSVDDVLENLPDLSGLSGKTLLDVSDTDTQNENENENNNNNG